MDNENNELGEKITKVEPEQPIIIQDIPQSISQPILLKDKPIYLQLALPVAIVFAALMISGTMLYTNGDWPFYHNQTADIGQKIAPQIIQIKIGDTDHILGDKNAQITIVEFADFRCPFCEKFYTETKDQIIKTYVDTGKARFVFKNFAFLGQQSVWASEAAECANEQGKYWNFFDWLFKNQAAESNLTYYSKENLIKYSGKVGLNTAQFAECLNSDKTAKRVSDDLAFGKAAGITGTPTFLIYTNKDNKFDVTYIQTQEAQNNYNISLPNGNSFIIGAQPFSVFQGAIDKLINK
jgi:protein-disulfide isomerase